MYHYTECGLQNVWLENGYKRHKTRTVVGRPSTTWKAFMPQSAG